MILIPTDHALEGPLVGPIGTIHKMAARTLLRGVRRPDRVGRHALAFGRPGQLLWDMAQLGRVEVSIHGTRVEAHRGHAQFLIDESGMQVIREELVDRPVDLLPDLAAQALPSGRARRREPLLGNALLLQAGPQPGLASPFGAIALVPPGHLAMKTAILFARRGREEMDDAHI